MQLLQLRKVQDLRILHLVYNLQTSMQLETPFAKLVLEVLMLFRKELQQPLMAEEFQPGFAFRMLRRQNRFLLLPREEVKRLLVL
jgi:hypothetical protein